MNGSWDGNYFWPDQERDKECTSLPETTMKNCVRFTQINKMFLHVKDELSGKECAVISPYIPGFAGVLVYKYRIVPLSKTTNSFFNANGKVKITDTPFVLSKQGGLFIENLKLYLAKCNNFGTISEFGVDLDKEMIWVSLSCCPSITFKYTKAEILTEEELYAAATFDMACLKWFMYLQKEVNSFYTIMKWDSLSFVKFASFEGRYEFDISLKKEENQKNPFWDLETGTLDVPLIECIFSKLFQGLYVPTINQSIVVPRFTKI